MRDAPEGKVVNGWELSLTIIGCAFAFVWLVKILWPWE